MGFAGLTQSDYGSTGVDAGEVKRRVDCRQLAERFGVRIRKRNGDNWTAHCFNPDGHNNGDANPSLSIFQEGFKCFGCGVSGDSIALWQHFNGGDFTESLAALADVAGLDAPVKPTRKRSKPRPGRRGRRQPLSNKTAHKANKGAVVETRQRVWRRIWDIVEPTPLTTKAEDWLASRGLHQGAAHLHGCRDWTAAGEIRDYLNTLSRAEADAAGLLNAKGIPWAPLRALRGEDNWQGLAIPTWHPGADGPIGVRWRFYEQPWPGGPKAMGQPRGNPALSWHVVGRPLSPEEAAAQHFWWWWPYQYPDDPGGWPTRDRKRGSAPVAVFLMEGETDWLAATSALVDIDISGWRPVIVGLCAMAAGWPAILTPLIAGADKIICLFDKGHGTGAKVARDIVNSLRRAVGIETVRERFLANLLPDAADAADKHESGDLRPLMLELMEG